MCAEQRSRRNIYILNRGGSPRGERPCRVGLRRRLADDGKRLLALDVASPLILNNKGGGLGEGGGNIGPDRRPADDGKR